MQHHLWSVAAALALGGCGHGGHALHGMQPGAGAPVCGEHMMSAPERDEHRRRMHEASSTAERERIRKEHHDRMVERARERGLEWRDGPGCDGSRSAG